MNADTVRQEFPNLPDNLLGLGELAENLWWSWHPAARMLFKRLSRRAWKESGHNPDKLLKDLPLKALVAASEDSTYLADLNLVLMKFREDISGDMRRHVILPGEGASVTIAYFSAEYGLHRSLPFYAGGLGFLAGDHLKESSDLGLPLVAIGFMYPEGYLRQQMGDDGWQENINEPLDRNAAPISRALDESGRQLVLQVPLFDPPIFIALWRVDVGRIPLYLIDTDIDLNNPWNRGISARLYIGDLEQRLRQEIVLGIGGIKAIEALGYGQLILHLNEGHAAFALLENIRGLVGKGLPFEAACEKARHRTVFTTHTPVPAGHDRFPFYLIEKYFHAYWPTLGLDRDAFLGLGHNPQEPREGFNMTALALRLSAHRNAVSKRHAEESANMWKALWPVQDRGFRPSPDFITNGVHVATWVDPRMALLFDRYLGSGWADRQGDPALWERVDAIPDKELWQTHYWLKIKLIDAIRERSRRRWAEDEINPSLVLAGGALLDPAVLTIGFARRFTAYKRPDLIFEDTSRMKRLLDDRWQPLQIIFAGKAHPADEAGKRVLQKVFNFCRDPAMGGRIAFVEDYGEQIAQYLLHGVDLWLNTPLPPLEACGTSGMKAALNGVPQLSVLDGWWLEGFTGKNGWAISHQKESGNPNQPDAEAVYRILEENIIPLYYQSSQTAIPEGWVKVMKAAIKVAGSKFSARRMVKDYCENFYSKLASKPFRS